MQVRLTDGTVTDVENAEGRRLIREGNAQAVTEQPVEQPAEESVGDPDGAKPRKKQ